MTVMRLNTTLMMTALAAAPLVTAAPADVALTYTSLVKPDKGAKSGAVLRASVLPGLALIPADAECCVVTREMPLGSLFVQPLMPKKETAAAAAPETADMGDGMPTMAMMPMQEPGPFDDAAFAEQVTSYAVAVSKGNAEAMSIMLPIMNYLSGREESEEMIEEWASEASADFADVIRGEKLTLSRKDALEAVKKVGALKFKPIYGVVTMTHDGGSALLPGVLKDVLKRSEGQGAQSVKQDGWQGWKYNLAELLELDPSDAVGKELLAAFKGRSVYHIFKIDGNALVACICESPDDCVLASSADESVLGTEKMAFYDPQMSHKLVCAAYVAPEILNTMVKATNSGINMMSEMAVNVFKALAREDAEKKLLFGTAARGVSSVAGYLKSLCPDNSAKPLTLGIWQLRTGAYHARLNMDACGASYAPGTLKLTKVASSDKTLFYTETTPYTPAPGASLVDVITPAVNVYNGYDTTLAESDGKGAQVASRINSFSTALKSVGKALGDTAAYVVFDVKGQPNLAYYNDVKNLKSLESAAGMLASSVGSLISGNRNMLRQYYKTKKTKTATTVDFTLPAELGGMKAGSICTAKKVAFGTSNALNALILKNATGKVAFTGSVYTLRPGAVGVLAQTAAAMDPGVAMIAGMAGAVLSSVGDIHAVDTITNGVRDIHIMVRAAAGNPGHLPVARPMPGGMTRPMPAPAADDSEEDEDTDDETEDEESDEEDAEEEDVEEDVEEDEDEA